MAHMHELLKMRSGAMSQISNNFLFFRGAQDLAGYISEK